MSISSIGGDAAQAWQALKENRAKQAASSDAVNAAAAPKGPPNAPAGASIPGDTDASGGATAAGGISSASAKVISDLKALFISLQASGASGTTAASPATATSPAAATGAAPASGTSANVQSDLQTLFGDLSKVAGHGGHRHGHGKHPAAPSATSDTDATAGATSASAKPAGGLLDQLAGALKAYAASSVNSSAQAATALPATALLSA